MSLQDSLQPAGPGGQSIAEQSEVEDLRAATAANFNPKPGPNYDHGMATAAEDTVVNTTAISANALIASTSNCDADAAPMVAPNAALTSALSFFPARVAKQMPQQHAPSSGLTLPSAGVNEADDSFAGSPGPPSKGAAEAGPSHTPPSAV